MEDEAAKRKALIEENLVNLGIDLEGIKKFAVGEGKSFDSLSEEESKELIAKFKNKDKQEEPKPEEENIIKKENVKAKILVKENNEIKEITEHKEQNIKKEEPKPEEPKQEEPKQEEPKQEEKKEEEKLQENNIPEKKEEKKENEVQNQPKQEIPNPQPQPKTQEQKTDNIQAQNMPEQKNAINQNPQQPPKKELILHKGLYFLEPYDFKTMPQQNNKLLDFVKNKKPIQILISEPKKESEGGFFSKSVYSYRIKCPELNSDIRRTYADFEWLRNQLNKRYPLRLTPVIPKDNVVKNVGKNLKSENEETFEFRKIRYLKRFVDMVLNKKIFATSPILYQFLVLDDQKFKKYKTLLDKKPYELEVGLGNLITVKGEVKCNLEMNTINDSESIINKAISLSDVYNQLISNFDAVVIDLNNLTQHLKNISILFNRAYRNITTFKYKDVEDMTNSFNELKILFENWSYNVNSQCEFFNSAVKETLNYMSLELNEINHTYKRYKDYKYEYEDFTAMIRKEKEDLMTSTINEELKKEENKGKQPNQIKINQKAFEDLFYNKNLLLIEEKKRLVTTMHYLIKDYNKLIKVHCGKVKDMDNLVKKTVVIDYIKG